MVGSKAIFFGTVTGLIGKARNPGRESALFQGDVKRDIELVAAATLMVHTLVSGLLGELGDRLGKGPNLRRRAP